MSYAEQIRHPSGALSNQDETRKRFWRFLGRAAIVAMTVYFAWRAGLFGKVGVKAVGAGGTIVNPHGWV